MKSFKEIRIANGKIREKVCQKQIESHVCSFNYKIQDTIFVHNTIHSTERYIISQHDKSGNIDFCSV